MPSRIDGFSQRARMAKAPPSQGDRPIRATSRKSRRYNVPEPVTTKKRGKGRPTKFDQNLVQDILTMAEAGKTDAEMAESIGVTEQTFNNWKHAHPDFFESLKTAKDIADDKVEVALFQRATGYSHKAIKMFCPNGTIVSKTYIERYPPDTTAAIFWLKNRRPKQWRDVHKLEHSGSDGGPIKTQVVGEAQVLAAVEAAVSRAADEEPFE